MPQISTQEFERLPLRVHDFLAGVPLHDVWAVDLPRTRSGITLDEFLRAASACLLTPSPVVRALLDIRLFVGRLLGWDREPAACVWETFATRLTTADLSQSLAPAGKPCPVNSSNRTKSFSRAPTTSRIAASTRSNEIDRSMTTAISRRTDGKREIGWAFGTVPAVTAMGVAAAWPRR